MSLLGEWDMDVLPPQRADDNQGPECWRHRVTGAVKHITDHPIKPSLDFLVPLLEQDGWTWARTDPLHNGTFMCVTTEPVPPKGSRRVRRWHTVVSSGSHVLDFLTLILLKLEGLEA